MAWQIEFRNGVWLPQIGWWLDARVPVDRSFVSHAHFDHLAEHREILCSPGTARLMRTRLPGKRIEHVLEFGQTDGETREHKTARAQEHLAARRELISPVAAHLLATLMLAGTIINRTSG